MGLIRGLFVRKDGTRGTSPVEARKALAGLITPAGAFGARPGVLSGLTVTGTAGWAYSIAPGHLVTSRSVADGVVLSANDGAATISTSPAPGTGGRIDLIWVRHGDVDLGDATSENVFGVTQGTVSASPVVPALPAGAMELARATVMAGAASTNAAGGTLTNTAKRTGLRGGTVEVPTYAHLETMLGDAPDGLQAWVASDNGVYVRSGGVWRSLGRWQSASMVFASGFSGSGTATLVGGWVEVAWTCSTSIASGAVARIVDTAGIPSGYRPSGQNRPAALFGTGWPMFAEVGVDGAITVRNAHSSAIPSHRGSATFPLALA